MLVKLKDICTTITDGSHYSPIGTKTGYPMLSVKDMSEYGFNYSDCKFISKENYEMLIKNGCKPKKNDVLIAKDGSYLKEIFVIEEEKEEVILSSIAILRPNLNKVNPYYLAYYLKTSHIKEIVSAKYVTGSVLKRIILKNFENIEIDLPSRDIQDKIANILSNIDNQIKRNNAMTKRLQDMGHTIYSKIMATPKTKKLLGDLVEMYQPETITSDKFIENGKHPVYGAGGIIGFYDNYNHENSELMVSCRGVCGKPEISLPKSFIIGNQMVLKPNNEKLKYFLYNYLLNCDLSCVETGSVQKQITRTNLEQLSILLPSESIINEHYNVFKNIYDRKIQIVLETEKLNQLKNTLLPLLINGQLEI